MSGNRALALTVEHAGNRIDSPASAGGYTIFSGSDHAMKCLPMRNSPIVVSEVGKIRQSYRGDGPHGTDDRATPLSSSSHFNRVSVPGSRSGSPGNANPNDGFFQIQLRQNSSSSRCSIQFFRSRIPSPRRKARRIQRVTQWYQRVTAGSTGCARAIVMAGSPGMIRTIYRIRPAGSALRCMSFFSSLFRRGQEDNCQGL
jgi:hypothetical protein